MNEKDSIILLLIALILLICFCHLSYLQGEESIMREAFKKGYAEYSIEENRIIWKKEIQGTKLK